MLGHYGHWEPEYYRATSFKDMPLQTNFPVLLEIGSPVSGRWDRLLPATGLRYFKQKDKRFSIFLAEHFPGVVTGHLILTSI